MKRGYRLLLELDPVDVLLIVSVVEYGVQVRNLLALRQKHRRQLAGVLPDGAGVDEPATVAGECAAAMDAGGDHAAAGVPREDFQAWGRPQA